MHRTLVRISLLGLALLVAAGPVPAQDAAEQPLEPGEGSQAVPTLHGSLSLSLPDAISMGLENNLNIEIERYAPLIAYQDTRIAWGAYDPNSFAEFGYLSDSQPSFDVFSGGGASTIRDRSTTRVTDGTVGVSSLVPYLGATVGLEVSGDRTNRSQDAFFLKPEYNSSVAVSASIPLLKNLIWNAPWTRVKSSKILHDESEETFRAAVMDTVTEIETAYWNLVATEEQERVARKSLETTTALLEQTRTQYEVGVVSRVEVTEAEAGVAGREVGLIRAENIYRRAQDQLIDLVLGPYLTAGSRLEIRPSDRPEDFVAYEVDVVEAVDRAFENRPELETARQEIERQELQLRFVRNQRLPQFDVQGSYAVSGKTGRVKTDPTLFGRPNPSPGADFGNFGDTFDEFSRSSGGDRFAIRGVFSIPLGNVAARHSVSKTKLELRRASTRLKRLEQSIVLEVRDTARNLESSQQGINAAERGRVAAAEQLRAERIRLEHGESTPFDVLLREEDLVGAETTKIDALRAYRVSVALLHRAQGTTLQSRNIVLDQVRALR